MNSEEKKIPYVIVGTDGKVEHGMVSAYDLKLKMCDVANSNNFGISRREWNDSERNKVVAENDKIVLYNGLFSVVGLPIMPNVVDVTVLNNRVVVVSFADSTETKAVLSEDDTFSVEQGIAICMMKKLIQMVFGNNCASVYNKLVEIGMNVYNDKLADIEKKKKAEAEEAERSAKRYAKAQRRKAKRAEKIKAAQDAEREAQIEIQKEAYLRAMREYNTSLNVSAE